MTLRTVLDTRFNKAQLCEMLKTLKGGRLGFDSARASKGDVIDQLEQFGEPALAPFLSGMPAVATVPAFPPAVAPVADVMPAVPAVELTVEMKSASEIFGIKAKELKGLMLPVCNHPDAPAINPDYIFNADVLAETLIAMFDEPSAPGNVWVYGPPGTGKTTLMEQIAARLGRPLFVIPCDSELSRLELFGGDQVKAGSTYWRDGIITKAVKTPYAVITFDEVTALRGNYALCLHDLLASRRLTIADTGESVTVATGVIFGATDNTNGSGDDTGNYVGTNRVNKALLDRFDTFSELSYLPPDEESELLAKIAGIHINAATLLVNFVNVCRASCETGALSVAPSLRRLKALAKQLKRGRAAKTAFNATIINQLPAEDREELQQLFNAHINAKQLTAALAGKEVDLSANDLAADETV